MGLTEDRRMGELAEQLVDFRQGTGLRNSPTKNVRQFCQRPFKRPALTLNHNS